MWKYVLKRLILAFFTLFCIVTISFVLIRLLPLDIGDISGNLKDLILARREALGYNKPIIEQYGIFLKNVFTKWDWGSSFFIDPMVDSMKVISTRLLPSILTALYPMIISIPLGILLGIYLGSKKGKWQDKAIMVAVVFFIAVPSYVDAFLLQYFLGYKLPVFPIVIYSLNEAGGSWLSLKMLYSYGLPIIALSLGMIASYARTIRAELSEVLTNDYMLLARTKGLTQKQAVNRHALKNAMVPILPGIIASFFGILSGAPLTEQIFAIPGVGWLMLNAIGKRDYDVFMATVAFFSATGLLAGIVYDISFGFLDPRIRMGASK